MMEQQAIPPHILLVDDDWMNREVIETFLQTEQFRVTTAANAQAGLKAIQDHPDFDLILLDAMLPDQNGFDLCRHLKAMEQVALVPIVMLTALDSDADKLRAVEAGADDFISKPFNYPLMVRRVKTLVQLKHLREAMLLSRTMAAPLQPLSLQMQPLVILSIRLEGVGGLLGQSSAEVATLASLLGAWRQLVREQQGYWDGLRGEEALSYWPAGGDAAAALHRAASVAQALGGLLSRAFTSSAGLPGLAMGIHYGESFASDLGAYGPDRAIVGPLLGAAQALQRRAQAGQIILSTAAYQAAAALLHAQALPHHPGEAGPCYALIGVQA